MGGMEMDDEEFGAQFTKAIRNKGATVLPDDGWLMGGTLVGWHYFEGFADDQVDFKVNVKFRGEIVAQVNDVTFLVREMVPTIRVSTGAVSNTETKVMNLAELREGIFFKSGHALEQHISFLGWVVRDTEQKFKDSLRTELKGQVQDK